MKLRSKRISLSCLLLWLIGFFSGCLNSDDPLTVQEQFDKDIGIIDQFLAQNNINAQIDNSGLRYEIHEQGTGDTASPGDSIQVNFKGRMLTSGTVFNSGEASNFFMDDLIAGWQIGIPLIREEGNITLYIPSLYGFGAFQDQNIPANSVLVFDIELLEVF